MTSSVSCEMFAYDDLRPARTPAGASLVTCGEGRRGEHVLAGVLCVGAWLIPLMEDPNGEHAMRVVIRVVISGHQRHSP